MSVKQEIEQDQQLLTEWRRDLHAHPEIAFEEHRTSSFVAERLESFGIEVHRGLAKTGVVGQLKAGSGNRAIALRADMDALPMDEHNAFDHRSEDGFDLSAHFNRALPTVSATSWWSDGPCCERPSTMLAARCSGTP